MNTTGAALLLCIAFAMLAADTFGAAAERRRVLVYTRNYVTNGKGYVHENIPFAVDAIKKIGSESGFDVDVSEDPAVFTSDNLKKYAAIVFCNSNNEAFETVSQRDAFRRYIRGGGGFVGIHSAAGSEREWPWFWQLLGGKFHHHPKIQPLEIRVVEADHPATRDLPSTFTWEDECYFLDNLNKKTKPLLVVDPNKVDDSKKKEYPGDDRFGNAMPLAWYHEFEGGRSFYTSLGHKKEHYQEPILVKHIRGGILWAMDKPANSELIKPEATEK